LVVGRRSWVVGRGLWAVGRVGRGRLGSLVVGRVVGRGRGRRSSVVSVVGRGSWAVGRVGRGRGWWSWVLVVEHGGGNMEAEAAEAAEAAKADEAAEAAEGRGSWVVGRWSCFVGRWSWVVRGSWAVVGRRSSTRSSVIGHGSCGPG